ncbi:carboxypeptidase-like regulatory domain-containing protein [Flavobacterium sp.]|jgi:hypothetical protein|uniref:FEKKY domain-containing protein n=1 Tax=Flavobacterium sp. TaxID=239 RepID=UPI003783C5F6
MKKIIYTIYLLLPILSLGQEMLVHGVVLGKKTREPLFEATVLIGKKHTGTHTDFDGKYVIKASLNDTLVVSYAGMKTQKVTVSQPEINIELEEIIIKEEFGPPYNPKPKNLDTRVLITREDIENRDNPKYNFKKNAKKNVFVIFVSALTAYDLNPKDLAFQQKYNVQYSLVGSYKTDYLRAYNKLTFKHLKKKYKKYWLTEIRKDAIGLKY